ncbi:MAG: glycosyltransferase family 4 protein [Candidatus Thermoplasmatota archaeon]
MGVSPTYWTIGLSPRKVEVIKGINIKLLNTTIPQDWLNSIFIGLDQVAKEFRPDFMWMIEEPHTLFALQGLEIAKKLECKYGVFTWENIVKFFPTPYKQNEQRVLEGADVIIVGNTEAKEVFIHYKNAQREKMVVMPMVGIDTNFFHPKNCEKKYTTLYVGNMLPWKGCPYIDAVVRELGTEHLWVGEGTYSPMYGDRAGYGDYLKLPDYYNSAKFTIHFSLPTESWKEQFNYVSCESLSCGLPVIVENSRIMKELFNGCKAVNFVEEGNVKSLRNKVKMLLEKDDKELEKMGKEGRKHIEKNFSNKIIAKRLIDCIKMIIQ